MSEDIKEKLKNLHPARFSSSKKYSGMPVEIVWPPSATEVQTSSEAKVDRPPRDLSA